jgi:hypothetical protein
VVLPAVHDAGHSPVTQQPLEQQQQQQQQHTEGQLDSYCIHHLLAIVLGLDIADVHA